MKTDQPASAKTQNLPKYAFTYVAGIQFRPDVYTRLPKLLRSILAWPMAFLACMLLAIGLWFGGQNLGRVFWVPMGYTSDALAIMLVLFAGIAIGPMRFMMPATSTPAE